MKASQYSGAQKAFICSRVLRVCGRGHQPEGRYLPAHSRRLWRKVQELPLDVFGGCLSVRKLSGQRGVSMVAIAFDIDPNKPLKTTSAAALVRADI